MKKRSKADSRRFTYEGVTIREVRPGYFMIDHQRGGRRERQCFSTLADAKTAAEQLAIAIRNEGASVLDLTPEQRTDAVKAIKLAEGAVTLYESVSFWMRHNGLVKGLTLSEVANKWLAALRAQGCRDTTMREREHKATRLVNDLGGRNVTSITRNDLMSWMDGLGLSGATRDGYRRCYRAMLQYAVEENMLATNPAAGIKAFRMDEKLPTPFTVKQVEAIMTAAVKYAPLMVPTLAVQFFAGLRPGEAKGLAWTAVDFTEKLIRITPETSKVRRTRIIDMTDACLAWLASYRQTDGFVGVNTQNQFDFYMTRKDCDGKKGVIGAAGVDWIQDGPRKTFASMHYAAYQDAARLAAILGHTGGLDILFRHYRGLVKKTEAERYWKMRPAVESGKVIQMKRGAA